MPPIPTRAPGQQVVVGVLLSVTLASCAPGEAVPEEEETVDQGALVTLIRDGKPVFGVFSGEMTREQGAVMARTSDADFILYSMEDGPFDVAGMAAYLEGMEEAAGPTALSDLPVILRVPPIEDAEVTRTQLDEALPTGIAGIVFPHAARPEQAAVAAALMGEAWPQNPEGSLLNILIVEDKEGIANAREIVSTPGLSVVFAGPGDLRRAYDGDMEAVENAIQTVLGACLESGVVCGITAGVEDIGARLDEGWGMIIVTQPEAVAVGKAHAGRGDQE